jgi:hypothetical protein
MHPDCLFFAHLMGRIFPNCQNDVCLKMASFVVAAESSNVLSRTSVTVRKCVVSIGCWIYWTLPIHNYIHSNLSKSSRVRVSFTLRLTVSKSVCLGFGHLFRAHDQIFLFSFLCRKIALPFVLGRPLWREDGSVIAICQWSESRRTHNHTLLSHLRILSSISVAS